jgi:hypothetical protein
MTQWIQWIILIQAHVRWYVTSGAEDFPVVKGSYRDSVYLTLFYEPTRSSHLAPQQQFEVREEMLRQGSWKIVICFR